MTKNTPRTLKTPFHLLIAAAGTGTRMGDGLPKQYRQINGKSILRYTIEKFININGLQGITVIINPQDRALYDDAVQGLNLNPPVMGGNSRQASIYNGLRALVQVDADDIILIHDAARPLICQKDITALLNTMQENEAATLASPTSDTLLRDDKIIPRDNLWAIQTPQAFKYTPLLTAHEKFKDDNSFTDDAGLLRATGHKVTLVPAARTNIKITTPEDFDMAQQMINTTLETRTTMGFDVHAFETTPSDRKLMLGGIHVPHDFALTGHSDADVVLHAITDALMGAINEGDIGTHFPPSDPQWKDADSAIFLTKATELLTARGGIIKFIDVTIMAEEPKIGPHRLAMQTRIANILSVPKDRVSIKATTTEKLGFTGRKEGMAAQAVATVMI